MLYKLGNTNGKFDSLKPVEFKAFSAFGTVGLSRGITPELSSASKIALTITMYGGRIGPLTLLVALARQKKEDVLGYPEEHLLIG